MNQALTTARRLLEQTGEHPVLSLYFDLDPAEFATPPARSTQLRSLVDTARAEIEQADTALDHEDRQALVADLERVESFLQSGEAPLAGARALAVFCSSQDQLFETVRLYEPVQAKVVIGERPYVEPLMAAAGEEGWCVALVNRSTARILAGNAVHVWERGALDDDVHGQHKQGGWSQARYERSVDVEVERHLHHVAEELRLRFEREPFHTLVLGGPEDTVSQLIGILSGAIRPLLIDERLSLDVQTCTEGDVRAALGPLLEQRRRAAEHEALERLRSAQGTGDGSAVSGRADTELALVERRVQTLLLSPVFDGDDDARSRAMEAAILQDASVLMFEEPPPEAHLR